MLIEAALFMGPILEEQGSRMNMRKSRFIYYGASAMPEETQEAIKKAGLTFVTRDSTISGEARKQHYIHGVPVGPSSAKGLQRWYCKTQGRKHRVWRKSRCCEFKMQWWCSGKPPLQ